MLNGAKIWTSNAHEYDVMLVFCRTGEKSDNRHAGCSQFIVDRTHPGVTMNPIRLITGQHHFNEIVFDNVELSDENLLGSAGDGWSQVTSELAFERSGPERFLTYPLLSQAIDTVRASADARTRVAIGGLLAQIWTLYNMSMRIFGRLAAGDNADTEAVLAK